MKKLSLALLLVSAFSANAYADSSVTVYGRVDLGLVKTSGFALQETKNHPSLLGFKGMEDLGGGLSAAFWLETGMEADTGAATGASTTLANFWNRDAAVGLVGDFGTVKLGLVKGLLKSAENRADPFVTEGVIGDGYNKYVMRAGTISKSRVTNSITYISPNVEGFVFSAQAILSESNPIPATLTTKAATAAGPGFEFMATYDNGPFSAHVGYEKPVGATPVAGVSQPEPHLYVAAAGYKFGDFKLTGAYTRGDTNVVSSNLSAAAKVAGVLKGELIGLTYSVGGGDAKLVYATQKNATNKTIEETGVGYDYHISKRTDLYAYAGNGRNRFTDAAYLANYHYQVGISHNF